MVKLTVYFSNIYIFLLDFNSILNQEKKNKGRCQKKKKTLEKSVKQMKQNNKDASYHKGEISYLYVKGVLI